ncbi:MAG TPA: hypothetical protein VFF29_07915, partial [Bacteroidota bacterium]|nr:hypothetical protein [Bacteroidota bacterium]
QEISSKGNTFFLQTGIIGDTEIEARRVAQLLRKNGGIVKLEEAPEGHNWTNWRARIPLLLTYFFPSRN